MAGKLYLFYSDQIRPEDGPKGLHIVLNPPRVLYVGHCQDEVDMSGWHTHDFCEISYISQGSCLFGYESEIFSAAKGDVVVMHPGVRHMKKQEGTQPLRMVYFGISDVQISGYPYNRLLPEGKRPVIDTAPYAARVDELFADLLLEAGSSVAGSYDHMQALAVSILVMLMRISQIEESPQDAGVAGSIKEFLDQNYTSAISLENIAKRFYISTDYVSHAFKEHTGLPLMAYVIQKRMEKAEELLITTDKSIVEITFDVGYNNPNYFSAAFKKYHAMTPGQYRSRYRKTKR